MKKLFLAVLAGLMVMAMASVASAEVTVGGELEVRYDVWSNLQLNSSAGRVTNVFAAHGSQVTETQSFWAQRVTLNVDAKITEGLEAFVELDTTGTEIPWGGQTGFALNNNNGGLSQDLSHQDGTLDIKQAWINFMVPGLPVGVKVGHQPLALGHGIWLDTHRQGSDAVLLYAKPIPELLLAGVYISGNNGSNTFPGVGGGLALDSAAFGNGHNDTNIYAVLANYTFMENNTVGVNFSYVSDNNMGGVATAHPGLTLGSGNDLFATNTMVTLDGSMGPLSYRGEFDWLFVHTARVNGGVEPAEVTAYAALLGADYQVTPMFKAGLEMAFGTGNDNDDASAFYNPSTSAGAGTTKNSGGTFQTMDHAYSVGPYGATSYNYAFLYNDKIGQGPLGTGGGLGFGDGFGGFGLANTGYVKLALKANPMDKLSVGLDAMYLHASAQAVAGQSRDLGWEVDMNASYKIYDNLTLDLRGGVFVPGAWYEYPNTVAGNGALFENAVAGKLKTDTAWGMETKLAVKF